MEILIHGQVFCVFQIKEVNVLFFNSVLALVCVTEELLFATEEFFYIILII